MQTKTLKHILSSEERKCRLESRGRFKMWVDCESGQDIVRDGWPLPIAYFFVEDRQDLRPKIDIDF